MHKTTKFLIIRFSSIGDIVLTTPAIRCLKLQFPDAEVHFVVKKKFRSVVEHNPYIDHLHLLDDNLDDLVKHFKEIHFDYIIDLHKTLRSYLIRLRLRRPVLSFRKLSVEKFLMNHFRINLLPKNLHIVERNINALARLGIKNDHKPVDYFIGSEAEVATSSLPVRFQSGYVAFVIGGQHFTKRLPTEKLIRICKNLDLPVILLGGPEDTDAAMRIEASNPDLIFNACGIYTLSQSVSLLKNANTVIAHDTGLMHISGAFNKNIVSVWGGTSASHFGVWPYLNQNSFLSNVADLSCQPCSNFGLKACPKKHFKCMVDQNESMIVQNTVAFYNKN